MSSDTLTGRAGARGLLGSLVGGGLLRQRKTLSELDDGELVTRIVDAGDDAAFAELVRRHEGRVRGLLMRLTHGDRTLADDLGQEVFLRAYRGLAGFEGRARFSTWLYRIAYNVYLNHRNRAKQLVSLPEDYERVAAAPEGEQSPGLYDIRNDLRAAIATLPERYRAVVVLYYLEDVSYPEIAEMLEMPLGTVKTHLHRARKELRAALPAWEPDAEVP